MGHIKEEEKAHAKLLFLDTDQKLTIKEIAKRSKVSARTLSKWIENEGWEKKRQSVLVTRPKIIADYYEQLEILNDHIKNRSIVYDVPDTLLKGTVLKDKNKIEYIEYANYNPTDYPIKIGNFPTSKEANQMAVIARNIKQLETETSIAEIYEVSTGVLEYIKPIDFELFKKLIPFFDGFINSKQ